MKYIVIVLVFITFVFSGCFNPNTNDDPIISEMVEINAGTFNMGDTRDQGSDSEKPIHEVTLTNNYYIGKYEVTNEEYCRFLNNCDVNSNGYKEGKKLIDMDNEYCQIGYNGTNFYVKSGKGNYPVIEVTWWGCIYYCNWLSDKTGLVQSYDLNTGEMIDYPNNKGYRLPTEAEWEYAARSRTNNPDYLYSGSDDIEEVAWYWNNSENSDNPMSNEKGTHEVGTKNPNDIGTYDMSGNVWEWCYDWWDNYSSSPSQNPIGPSNGSYRIRRGGSWYNYSSNCRVVSRSFSTPDYNYYVLGFRLCKTK